MLPFSLQVRKDTKSNKIANGKRKKNLKKQQQQEIL